MTLEERTRLSFYQELAPIDAEHCVFLVRHSETGAIFVRKTLANYQTAVFRKLKDHSYKGLPRIYEAIEDGNKLIVIESYISGRNLQEVLEENGSLPAEQVLSIARSLCAILAPLHEASIVHRDIKPSNIILSDDGYVSLLDLDAAKICRPEESRDTHLLGTKGYAAPEQYGFGSSRPETDIYALGVLLHVLLTGSFPGQTDKSAGLLAPVIIQCTQMDPEERYHSVRELDAALNNVQQELSLSSVSHQSTETGPSISTDKPVRKLFIYDPPLIKGPKKFFPPGFRQGKSWHVLISLIWYLPLLIFLLYINHVAADPLYVKLILGTFVLTIALAPPFIICNYLGILDRTRIRRITSPGLRFLAALGFTIAIIGTVFLILSLIVRLIQGPAD